MNNLEIKLYEVLEGASYKDDDDVYYLIYDYLDEKYPEMITLLEDGELCADVIRYNEGPNTIGYDVMLSLNEIMESEFKLKYPEEVI